jgi:hypothetical protein
MRAAITRAERETRINQRGGALFGAAFAALLSVLPVQASCDGSSEGSAGCANAEGCKPPDDGGADSPEGSAGTAGTAGAGGFAGTGGTGLGAGLEFDDCESDEDCAAPRVCRAMNLGATAKRCTRPCSTTSECMTGTRCNLGTGHCAFEDNGKPCQGPGICAEACLGQGYCTSLCASGFECPGGWGCVPTSSGNKACVRLDQECDATSYSACLSQEHCDEQTLLAGGCTIQCDSADDCPQRAIGLPAWRCEEGACTRPDKVRGAIPKGETTAWACDASNEVVNLCADGLTLDSPPTLSCPGSQPLSTTGPCFQSCRYDGGCGFGWACVGVGIFDASGQRFGLCMRTGPAELGEACTRNEDCVFGLCHDEICSRDCTVDDVCPRGFNCVAGGASDVEGNPFMLCE